MNVENLDQIVGVHVGNDLVKLPLVSEMFSPPRNWIGVQLLGRVLELALLREGLTQGMACTIIGTELTDCAFMAIVSEPAAAVEAIKRELDVVRLLPFSQIGILEGASWRCLHPSAEVRMHWLMDAERLEFDVQKFLKADSERVKFINELLNRLRQRGQQEGGKQ